MPQDHPVLEPIEPCARKDLSKEDYDTFKRMVLKSQQLDKEIVSLIERVPKYFDMGLMPSVAGEDCDDVDLTTGRVTAAPKSPSSKSLRPNFRKTGNW